MKSKTLIQKHPDLSIIIPAFSEEKRIGRTLDQLAKFLKNDPFFSQKKVEVLVVAADTSDKTHKIVVEKQSLFDNCQLLKPGPRVGKGRDVQYGMLRANGEIAIFMDADLATPLSYLQKFYETCASGTDIVIGTRNLLRYRSNILRNIFSYGGNLLYRIASGIWIDDTQCGFKMFNRRAREVCFSRQTIMGWDFDTELLAIAKVNKMNQKAYRIDDWTNMPYSTHTDGILKIIMRTTKSFGQVAVNRMLGTYKE